MMQSTNSSLLTIRVPSYIRGNRVHASIIYFLERVVRRHSRLIKLLVVNNTSMESARKLLEPLVGDGLRLVNCDRHLPSAEANIPASGGMCKGQFVWFHGDDDTSSANGRLRAQCAGTR